MPPWLQRGIKKHQGTNDGTLTEFMASATSIWLEAAHFTNAVYYTYIFVQISTSSHQV